MRVANKSATIEEGTPEQKYEELKKVLQEAAYEALGQEEQYQRKTTSEWWNTDTEELVAKKKAAYNKWLMTREVGHREKYIHIRRKVNKMINKSKNETWQKKCSEINCYLGSTRSSEAWKTLKGLRKDTQEKSNMSLITMEEWKNYCKTLLTEERTEFLTTEQHEYTNDQQVMEITTQEVSWAVKGMKNRKAAGPGGLQIELIKNAPSGVYEILARIFNKCLQGEEIPQEWKKAHITSIY